MSNCIILRKGRDCCSNMSFDSLPLLFPHLLFHCQSSPSHPVSSNILGLYFYFLNSRWCMSGIKSVRESKKDEVKKKNAFHFFCRLLVGTSCHSSHSITRNRTLRFRKSLISTEIKYSFIWETVGKNNIRRIRISGRRSSSGKRGSSIWSCFFECSKSKLLFVFWFYSGNGWECSNNNCSLITGNYFRKINKWSGICKRKFVLVNQLNAIKLLKKFKIEKILVSSS